MERDDIVIDKQKPEAHYIVIYADSREFCLRDFVGPTTRRWGRLSHGPFAGCAVFLGTWESWFAKVGHAD